MFDDAMTWGKPQVENGWIYDKWTEISVIAPVWGRKGTFAFSARNDYPGMENSAWVDARSARQISEYPDSECPECICPTREPCPTKEPCVPCPTVQPACDERAIAENIINFLENARVTIQFPE